MGGLVSREGCFLAALLALGAGLLVGSLWAPPALEIDVIDARTCTSCMGW